jgi:hypothetical protein
MRDVSVRFVVQARHLWHRVFPGSAWPLRNRTRSSKRTDFGRRLP